MYKLKPFISSSVLRFINSSNTSINIFLRISMSCHHQLSYTCIQHKYTNIIIKVIHQFKARINMKAYHKHCSVIHPSINIYITKYNIRVLDANTNNIGYNKIWPSI